MELINTKRTTGAVELTGQDIFLLFAVIYLRGGAVKTRIQKQALATSPMPAAV